MESSTAKSQVSKFPGRSSACYTLYFSIAASPVMWTGTKGSSLILPPLLKGCGRLYAEIFRFQCSAGSYKVDKTQGCTMQENWPVHGAAAMDWKGQREKICEDKIIFIYKLQYRAGHGHHQQG